MSYFEIVLSIYPASRSLGSPNFDPNGKKKGESHGSTYFLKFQLSGHIVPALIPQVSEVS